MNPLAQRILVLAPHTDDGELGCGATLKKYITAGSDVYYVAFSTCAESLSEGLSADTLVKECKEATKSLGIGNEKVFLFDYTVRRFGERRQDILEDLVSINRKYQPTLVFLPAQNDIHQDHQVIYQEGIRAFKNSSVLGYELPWNNNRFQPNYFESVSEDELLGKMNALQQYQSQSTRTYMSEKFIRSLAVFRGIQANTLLAEAFEVYKIIH